LSVRLLRRWRLNDVDNRAGGGGIREQAETSEHQTVDRNTHPLTNQALEN
jgi:hypothetical protein